MNTIKAYTTGFKLSLRSPRMILLLYALNFILAILLAIPFFEAFQSSAANSLITNLLSDKMNFTAIIELITNADFSIGTLLAQIKWFVLVYWLLSVFLTGGIISIFNKEKFSVSQFFTGASKYFFRFLAISVIMLIVHILLLLIAYIPAILIIDSFFKTASSELTFYYIFIFATALYFIWFFIVLMINDYAKVYLLLNDTKNIFKAIWKSTKYVFRHLYKTYSLYLLSLVIPMFTFYIYYKLLNDVGMTMVSGIIIMFFIQQFVVLLRVWFRIWLLASQFEMYSADIIMDVKIKIQREVYEDLDKKAEKLSKKMIRDEKNTEKLKDKPIDSKSKTKENKDKKHDETINVKKEDFENKKYNEAEDIDLVNSLEQEDTVYDMPKVYTEEEMLKKMKEDEGLNTKDDL